MKIIMLNAETAYEKLPELVVLLQDAVNSGASIGFLPPLSVEEAQAYWQKRIAAVVAGDAILLLAILDGEAVATAQLGLESRANGAHRAEVQKVMVHTAHRRKGIGKALMQALEAEALSRKISLLVLDTRQGDPSEILYVGTGYVLAGTIPNYARSVNGELHATVFYYKLLDEA